MYDENGELNKKAITNIGTYRKVALSFLSAH